MTQHRMNQDSTGQTEPVVCGWDNCPERVRRLVNDILACYKQTLREDLVGFYLHGSLAMGCFVPSSSDVDFLAVVKTPITVAQKRAIIDFLLERSEGMPVADIEMSIVLEEHLKHFVYPTPFELHYSIEWYERYRSGQVDFSEQGYDEDLAAHFVIARHHGLCLFGEPIREVFPEIPRELYVKSLAGDARWICENPGHNPSYTILNLCRILAFLKQDRIMSKREGAEWGLEHLPRRFSPLIESALSRYSDASGRQPTDTNALHEFAEFVGREIESLAR